MGLCLLRPHCGIGADYWKITEVRLNHEIDTTSVVLSLYLDKETRDADVKNILEQEHFTFSGIEADREELYLKIKEPRYEQVEGDDGPESVQVNVFVDATDVE